MSIFFLARSDVFYFFDFVFGVDVKVLKKSVDSFLGPSQINKLNHPLEHVLFSRPRVPQHVFKNNLLEY